MDRRKPIIALDFQEMDELEAFLNRFDQPLNVKIGMELYYTTGTAMIQKLKAQGHDIFLDLKLHDIPNTVKWAMKTLASQGVSMINVHALGGKEMMEQARKGLLKGTPQGQKPPILLAVTQLTSTTPQQVKEEQAIALSLQESVGQLAQLTHEAGLDGVVCSPLEVQDLKQRISPAFITVTPGIRPQALNDDQKRTATPYQAALNGSDYIVVGRPITQADDPVAAYEAICSEWQRGLDEKRGKYGNE